jgi:DNA-directed RNA polymerase III subunit RPC3
LLTFNKRDLIIRVNYEKCTVALRNERLIALASHDIGATTARVYAELLRLLEKRVSRCQLNPSVDDTEESPDELPSATTITLTQALSKSVNVSRGIAKTDDSKVDISHVEATQRKRKRPLGDAEAFEINMDDDEAHNNGNIPEVDQDSDSHGEDDFDPDPVHTIQPSIRQPKVTFQTNPPSLEDQQNRMAQTNSHLLLLAEHSPSFVTKCGNGGRGEWTVDFARLVDYLQQIELDTFVLQTFGRRGHRIARILREKGKLDEKQIPKIGLLKTKDVRTSLIQMHMAGFVDIQEIPRDNNRTAQRTIFLWFFDTERVTAILMEKIYKTMSRSLQVLKVQKREYSDVLSLAERTDVKGQEEELLAGDKLRKLRTIRDQEERILAEISRLDQLVSVFRDF